MRDSLKAHRLRVREKRTELRLAAHLRLDGENLRIRAVVPALVPSD